MYVCMYVYMYVCINICMHVCMYALGDLLSWAAADSKVISLKTEDDSSAIVVSSWLRANPNRNRKYFYAYSTAYINTYIP